MGGDGWSKYFAKQMAASGYGKQFNNPLILLIDGHSSRWTYPGLKTLIDAGIYPFFIGSHTSAWAQPNDVGLNMSWKSKFKAAVKQWRLNNPFSPFDRIAYNKCCVAAIQALEYELAVNLEKWKAKFKAWKQCDSPEVLKPKGKADNVITRMYERTGWWPLKKDSELWQKSIDTLGVACKPTKHKILDKQVLESALTRKGIEIRKLVLQGFQDQFLDKAYACMEEAKSLTKRRRKTVSIINTTLGCGLTACEDLVVLKEAEERRVKKAKAQQKSREVRDRKRQQKKMEMEVTLHEAKTILFHAKNRRPTAHKQLKNRHYIALLTSIGKGKLARTWKRDVCHLSTLVPQRDWF